MEDTNQDIQEESQEQEETQEETSIEEKEKEETSTEVSDESSNDEGDIDFSSMSDEDFEKYLFSDVKKETKPEAKPEEPVEKENKQEVEEAKDNQNIDYKAFYESMFKPFKANGKEITPRNRDDIIALMQMGANYTKKMQLLAPMKKAVESLNKAGIDEGKLNFLIDVYKGDQNAIRTLLKERKIDPMEWDLDEKIDYVPNNNLASDRDVEFTDTLQDVSESLPKIKEIIDRKWDEASKNELLSNPKLLQGLHEEIQLGRFDKIQAMLERERTFGRYKNVPDIRAYSDIVTQVVQQEGLKQQQQVEAAKKNTKVSNSDKSKAAPTKYRSKARVPTMSAQDLLTLSDEDFEKLDLKNLI